MQCLRLEADAARPQGSAFPISTGLYDLNRTTFDLARHKFVDLLVVSLDLHDEAVRTRVILVHAEAYDSRQP